MYRIYIRRNFKFLLDLQVSELGFLRSVESHERQINIEVMLVESPIGRITNYLVYVSCIIKSEKVDV